MKRWGRWGENKLVVEEGLIAGLLGFALGMAAGAALMPAAAFRGGLALAGLDFDGGASLVWAEANRVMAALGLVVPLCLGSLGAFFGFLTLARQTSEWHFQGAEYEEDPADFRPELQAHERALFSAAQAAGNPRGVVVGGVELSRTREVGHMFVAGLPGSGKTTLLKAMIGQALGRGDRVLIHDPKADFIGALTGDGRDARGLAVVLGPWDARARPWDIAADVNTPERAMGFATAVIPIVDAGSNQFFVDSARETLAALVKHLQRRRGGAWGWDDLGALLRGEQEDLVRAAWDGEPLTKSTLKVGDRGNTTSSILGDLIRFASWIPAYAEAFTPDAAPFSLRAWLSGEGHQEARAVILNTHAGYGQRSQQIFSAILSSAASVIASPDMNEVGADAPGTWMLIDEYPQLGTGAADAIRVAEEMGRSRGIRVVKAVQDASQIMAVAGRDKGEATRSVQQARIYLKLASGSAAELSKQLGDRDIRRVELPQVVGAGNKRIVADRSPVLRAESLTGLRVVPGQGVEMIAHIDDRLGKLVQPFPDWPPAGVAMVPNPRWDCHLDADGAPLALPGAASPALSAPAGIELANDLSADDLPMPLSDPDAHEDAPPRPVEMQRPAPDAGLDPFAEPAADSPADFDFIFGADDQEGGR